MNEHDVIKYMGRFPDKIITNVTNRNNPETWQCSTCENIVETIDLLPNPCVQCGGLCWVAEDDKEKKYENN